MRLLFVENDPTMAHLLSACADRVSKINVAHNTAEAAAMLAPGHTFDAVVIDWMLDDADGLDIARGLRTFGDPVPIVMTSAASMDRFTLLGDAVSKLGRAACIQKPWTIDEVIAACRVAGAVPKGG